jgi:endonuclease/exonuclease/phosphatase family metal-dependent hydrolase
MMNKKIFLIFISVLYFYVQGQADCPAAPPSPADRRTNKTNLVVSTFNAEWLFLKDGHWSNPIQHIQNIAQVISRNNPDIIVLQEVENCTVLKLLNSYLSAQKYLPYLVKGTDTGTGQNVALLSRIDPQFALTRTDIRYSYPLTGSKCGYTCSSCSSTVSKHFYTYFDIQNFGIVFLLGHHFIAIPTEPARCAQREAQASVMRQIAFDAATNKALAKVLPPGVSVDDADFSWIITGDFNDYDDKLPDALQSVPNSRALSIIRNNGDIKSKYSNRQLISVASNIPQNQRYTNHYSGGDTMIDHLLVTGTLTQRIKSAFIDHTHSPDLVSDHWPIIVAFV